MRKRTVKKLLKTKALALQLEYLARDIESNCKKMQDGMVRLSWLTKENTNLISRFPIKVEDFATHPPIHNGNYLVYFVRKNSIIVRFYTFVENKWFDSLKNEIDLKSLYPSCYLQCPVLSEDAIEVYRRRSQ